MKYPFTCLIIGLLITAGCLMAACQPPLPTVDPAHPTEEFCVFVDIVTGTSGASGTRQDPVDDIREGIELAAFSLKAVCVAQGTYEVDSSLGTPTNIVMVPGVSLYGGYQNDAGTWTRDPVAHPAIIRDLTLLAGSAVRSAVTCGAGVSRSTVLDGFEIHSGYGSLTTAIYCYQGSPTISNNQLYGYQGASTGSYNYVIMCDQASPRIDTNTLYGGTNHEHVGDISFLNGGTAYVVDNTILNGTPNVGGLPQSCGIWIGGCAPTLRHNTIYGGSLGDQRFGIYVASADPVIVNNVVDPGMDAAESSVGIFCLTDASPLIDDNVIKGGINTTGGLESYGVVCYDGSHPIITNNVIQGGSSLSNTAGVLCQAASHPDITDNIIWAGDEEAGTRHGVWSVGSSPLIARNIFNSYASPSRGVSLDGGSAPVITGNTFRAGPGDYRFGIFEVDSGSDPAAVTGNFFSTGLLSGTGSALYRDVTASVIHTRTTIEDVNNLDTDGYNPPNSVSGNSLE